MPEKVPAEVSKARAEMSRLVAERETVLRERAATGGVDRIRLQAVDQRISGILDRIRDLVDPADASPADPLVLLPVRLETRFVKKGRKTSLQVRIYPDEIHVDALERGLTPEETAAGQAWWTAAWTDPVPDDAFGKLVDAVGAARAEWVAHATTPTNLSARLSGNPPKFPETAAPGNRGALARALPDRFVVLAIRGDTVTRAVGQPVPRDLQISPLPGSGGETELPVASTGGIAVPPGSEWLVDYDEAVKAGMGVTVPLPGDGRLDRVIVLGARGSTAPETAAGELEDLFTAHRFAEGFGLLQQGAPTNNSDAARSPFSSRPAPSPPPLAPSTPAQDTDTAALARTLGVDAGVLAGLLGAGAGEQQIAGRVNAALWAATWGDYLRRLEDRQVTGIDAAQRESARQLFGAHVRGRGPAPAIRVGAQPYGVLPVSDLRSWVPQAGETTKDIRSLVVTLLDRWLLAADASVPRIRAGQTDIDATMLEVLGSSPVMQYLRVRPMISDDAAEPVEAATGIIPQWYEWEKQLTAAIAAIVFGADASKLSIGSLDKETRPLPLPLVSERDDEFINALLGSPSRVLAVDSVLQALLFLAWQSHELDVAKASPATVVPHLVDVVDADATLKSRTMTLVGRAHEATSQELFALAAEYQAAPGSPQWSLSTFQPVAALQTSLAEVALSAPQNAEAKAMARQALSDWFRAMGYRAEVRTAMTGLVGTDRGQRRLAVAEALDLCSHRLDAWATAVVAERRALHAAHGNAGGRGLTIGAYGVVEALGPRDGAGRDGWIHAPSPRHAITAGMLRSAHLSHLPAGGSATDPGAFAIDLSSARTRTAVHVLEGVRSGQQLAAVIGYQIERDLVETGLARFQLSLRAIAPLVARRLTDRPGTPGTDTPAAQETVAATNVVDGLLLLKTYSPGDAALRHRLDTAPDNVYLPPGGWPPLTDDEWTRITHILQSAEDTIDAVADVMLSEAVQQYAGGNPHRAAAAMDAMGAGAGPADRIDVLEAHDDGERLTHRALVVIGADAPATTWNAARPRAQAEPRLEAWASEQLGPPADIVVATVGHSQVTLADAGFAALDLVFARDANALEAALRAALPAIGDAPLAVSRKASWPVNRRSLGEAVAQATSLQAVIAGSQPLLPADLARPGTTPARDLAAALADVVTRAESAAAALASAVATLAGTVGTIPDNGIVSDESTAGDLQAAIHGLDAFGIPLVPGSPPPLDVAWVRNAWLSAEARSNNAQTLVQRMHDAASGGGDPQNVLDAVHDVVAGVFGDGFLVLPVLAAPAGDDPFVQAVTASAFPAPAGSAVRRFVQDAGTVRPQMRRWSETQLIGTALGRPRPWSVAQLSEVGDGGPAPGTTVWLAGPLPPAGPWPDGPVGHLVLDVLGSVKAGATVAGLVVDAWVEDLPAQPGVKADPKDPRPGRARTGLALRADAPSARPPQAVLCAVSPDGKRWTTDALRAVVEQTLDLAKARLVTLERLQGEARVLPALYTQHAALQGQSSLLWTALAQARPEFVAAPFVKDKEQ